MRTEHQEQALVIQWAERMKARHPELDLLFAIPNGGDRNVVVATKLKREGVRSGVPDLCLPVPRGRAHGLWIEMKRRKVRQTKTKGVKLDRTKPTPEQERWHEALRAQGYIVEVCWSAEEAQGVIAKYLEYTPPERPKCEYVRIWP